MDAQSITLLSIYTGLVGYILLTLFFVYGLVRHITGRAALLAVALQWCVDVASLGMLPLYWHLRSPLLWWAYFLIGWQIRLHHARVTAWVQPRTVWLAPILLVAIAALALSASPAAA